MNAIVKATFVLAIGAFTIGCANNAQNGALIGTALGAGIGAGAGSFLGSAGKGALIGGGAGALTGYIAGNEMDKAEARHEQRAYDRYTSTPAANQEAGGVSTADVINWTRQGVKDEIIIDRIQRSGSTFRLTAADENQLRDAGVSEEVVRAMKYNGR